MFISATINEITREIKWDKSQVAAVDGDYAVNGFKLNCLGLDPDYNLTTGTWYAVFTDQNGTSHSNPLTVSGGVVTWEFDNNINKGGSGVIKFFLYAVTTNAAGKVLKRWDSAITDLRVAGTIDYENQEEEAARESEIDRLAGLVTTLTATAATINDVKAVLARITNSSPVVVATVADLSGLDTTEYQLAIVRADGYLYYYDGSAWQQGIKYGSYELDTTLTESGKAADAAAVGAAVTEIKEDLSTHEVRITELEDGGSGGLSKTAVNLLNTILSEAVYGSDQTANIELLKKELSNVAPVSISAILDGTALAGQSYSELSFIVTATFDDDSTAVVDKYTVITTGTVKTGSNTVTIKYRGVTTTCTFNAEQVTTYTITNDLTNATTSNNTSVVVENDRYTSEITIESGYDVSVFTVTMGGVDVTATVKNGNNIVIDSVTGDVVITVTAVTPAYLDPLIRMRGGFDSVAYLCPDNHVSTAIRINNALSPMVSEYPAQNDCTITYRIENNTGESVPVNNLGFALLSGADSDWVTKNEYPYYSKVAIPIGESLAPGEYIEGTYLWKAGYQIVCTTILSNIGKLDIKLKGAYVPVKYDEDDSYDKYVLNSETQHVFHTYATQIDWYADDSTSLANKKMSTLYYITDNLSSGTYDLVFRLRNHNIGTSSGLSYLSLVAGTVNELTESTASIYNSFASGRTVIENVWMYKRVTVAPGNNILVPSSGITNLGINDKLFEFFFKEVSA